MAIFQAIQFFDAIIRMVRLPLRRLTLDQGPIDGSSARPLFFRPQGAQEVP